MNETKEKPSKETEWVNENIDVVSVIVGFSLVARNEHPFSKSVWGEKIYTDEWLVLHVSMCLVLGCLFPMEDLVSLPNGVWAKPKLEGKTFPMEKASLTSCLSA